MQMIFVPHRKHLSASMVSYGGSFTFLYVDDVRTSQEAQISTACYWDSCTFYMQMMFIPHRKHRPSVPVTGLALLFYMYMMFVLHMKHRPPLSVIEIALLFYVDDK
jgi:hypothetical protein